MKNEIILYRPNELAEHIEVMFDEDTVWLTQAQIAVLFNRTKQNISLHINNVFKEGELIQNLVVKEYLITTQHGAIKGKTQSVNVNHYNLDVIISVGYRVKSQQGTHFRIWATQILKDYLLKGYVINSRVDRLEDDVEAIKSRMDGIDLRINTHHIPTQGVFYEGQVFDAYEHFSKLIKSAKNSVTLIDNYVDETTLVHIAKKNRGVKELILTRDISKQLALDIQKADA